MLRRSLLTLTAVAVLAFCASAQAADVTVGSPLTAAFVSANAGFPGGTLANTVLPGAGSEVTSPVTGAVVSWHLLDASGGPFDLRVLQPASPGVFSVVTATGTSAQGIPDGLGLQTFATDLPITAGDLIGIDTSNSTDKLGVAPELGEVNLWEPRLSEGVAMAVTLPLPIQLAMNAVVQPAPGISGVGPASGPTGGGTSVVIAGSDLEGASAVKFGSNPAGSYTVDSESQITATAPAGSAGAVPVSVTTIAGTAISTQTFTYVAAPSVAPLPATCKVPYLKGQKLKASKKKSRVSGCKIGTVTKRKGVTAKTGKVVKQNPKPGKVLAAGTKIRVVLGG